MISPDLAQARRVWPSAVNLGFVVDGRSYNLVRSFEVQARALTEINMVT